MITSIFAPRINPNDEEVGVVQWRVQDGDRIEVGAELVDLETSKTTVTVEAEVAGVIRTIAKKGEIIPVGAPLYQVAHSADEFARDDQVPSPPPTVSKIVASPTPEPFRSKSPRYHKPDVPIAAYTSTRLSQAARVLIQDLDLNAQDYAGAGLVTARAVRARQNMDSFAAASAPSSTPAISTVKAPAQIIDPGCDVMRTESLSLSKRSEIHALSIGASGLINSTLSVYFESATIRARLEGSASFDGNIQPLLLYEISRLLRLWPQFTAYFEKDSVAFYDRIDLGLAIDLGTGLKVVTIKDADTLMPIELFEKTIDFALRYVENRLRSDELVGSTITVTDLSSLDILHFKPLINGKQSAIIGIGGDSTQPGHPMSVNMTFDHRVATGRQAGSFLKELRDRIVSFAPVDEQPGSAALAMAQHNAVAQRTDSGPVRCDSCGIDYETYTTEFGRQANMLARFNQDGSISGLCHRCYAGWI
jgi:pyruvate/2-oxoglutarate dehydrogenase complex dihydrolipoamide acyltransferase (E2) component